MLLNLWVYVWFLFVSIVFCLIAFPLVVIARILYNPQQWSRFIRLTIATYERTVVKVVLFPFIRVDFQDKAKSERESGIFVVNHRCGLDAFLMVTLRREVCLAVKDWPLTLPFFGFFARQGEYLNITELRFEDLEKQVLSLLQRNVNIVVFPEGTRSNSQELNQFHGGIFRIALAAKSCIYPLCIVGSEKVINQKFRISAGTIRIRKLPCIKPETYSDMTAFAMKTHIRRIIADECREMDANLQGM